MIPRVYTAMGAPASFVDLSSDEEDNHSTDQLDGGFSAVEQMKAGSHSGVENCARDDDSDDDCQVLDSDPDKTVLAAPDKDSGEDGDDELVIVGEKGQLACRDFPHSRHLCANFLFSSSPHAEHCSLCHCYVCDSPAPCKFWGNGMSKLDHCHSTDKDKMWRSLRQFFKNLELSQPQKHGIESSGNHISLQYSNSVQVSASSLSLNTLQPCSPNSFQPCSATGLGNSLQTFPVTSLANILQPCSGTILADPLQHCPDTSLLNTLQPASVTNFPRTMQPCSGTILADPLQPCLDTSLLNTLQPAFGTSFPRTKQPSSGTLLADPLQPYPGTSLLNTLQPAFRTSFPRTKQPSSGTLLADPLQPYPGTSLLNTLQPASGTSFPRTKQPCSGTILADPLQPCTGTSLLNTLQPALGTSFPRAKQPCSGTILPDPLQPCTGTSLLNTLQPALGTSFPRAKQPCSGTILPDPLQPCTCTSLLNTLQPALGTSFPRTMQPCLSTSFTSTLQPCSSVDNTYLNNQRHHRQLPVHSFHSQRTGPYSATTYHLNSRPGSVRQRSSLSDSQTSNISSCISYKKIRSIYDFQIFNQNAGVNSLSTNQPHSSVLNNNWRPNHALQKPNSANVTSHSFQHPEVQQQISHNSRLISTTVCMDEIGSAPLRSYRTSAIFQAIDDSKSWQDILAFTDSNIEVPSGNRQNFTVIQQPNAVVVSQPMPYNQEVSHRVANQGILSSQSTPAVGQMNSPSYFHSRLNRSTIPGLQQHPRGENSHRSVAHFTANQGILSSQSTPVVGQMNSLSYFHSRLNRSTIPDLQQHPQGENSQRSVAHFIDSIVVDPCLGINQNGSNNLLPAANWESQQKKLKFQDD